MIGKARRALRVGSAVGEDQNEWGMAEPADEAPPPGAAQEAEEECRAALGRLDARERRVVSLRFGLGGEEPVTLKEAGDQLGVTREWIRKLELRALARMGAALEDGMESAAEAALGLAVWRRSAKAVPGWDDVVEVARGRLPSPTPVIEPSRRREGRPPAQRPRPNPATASA